MKRHGILLALSDGDSRYSMAIRLALEGKGNHVTVPGNHDSAIDAVQANHFDVVITDLLAVLEKAKEYHPETMGVVVLSTRNKWDPICRIIRSSPDDCLFRPFELTELEVCVNHCLERLERLRSNLQPEWCKQGLDEKILNKMEIMSHDIRGPLIFISATLKLLIRGHYGKMDEEVLNRIKELSSKITGLTGIAEEYLLRSFSANDDLKIEEEPLDLMRDILIPVLKEFSPELRGCHLIIDHSLRAMSSRRISLKTNPVLLKMVFRNLLKNAIKYGDARGVIALGFEDHGSSYKLNVYNSGRPIPEEYRKRLFTKFTGIGNRDNGEDGIGLGLYLTKKVIQKLGGYIWYEAREDGSDFVFTFPARSTFSAELLPPVEGAQLRLLTSDNLGLEKDQKLASVKPQRVVHRRFTQDEIKDSSLVKEKVLSSLERKLVS
jgi:signal transduction histidine kinase